MDGGIHINRGTNRRFIAQSRMHGYRNWRTLKDTQSKRVAIRVAGDALLNPNNKRARVLFCSDWYDPVVLVEMVRP